MEVLPILLITCFILLCFCPQDLDGKRKGHRKKHKHGKTVPTINSASLTSAPPSINSTSVPIVAPTNSIPNATLIISSITSKSPVISSTFVPITIPINSTSAVTSKPPSINSTSIPVSAPSLISSSITNKQPSVNSSSTPSTAPPIGRGIVLPPSKNNDKKNDVKSKDQKVVPTPPSKDKDKKNEIKGQDKKVEVKRPVLDFIYKGQDETTQSPKGGKDNSKKGGRWMQQNNPVTPPTRHLTTKIRKRTVNIVGGENAPAYLYKSIVSVKINDRTQCGGTLVRPDWVVTAAHCTKTEKNASHYAIIAGEWDRGKVEGFEQERIVKQIIIHKQYDTPNAEDNDIALFRLEKPVVLSDKIQVVQLPLRTFKPQKNVTAVGWGITQSGTSMPSPVLQKVELPLLTVEECRSMYEEFPISPKQLCTYHVGGGKDACQGDSGGPLYSIDPETNVQTLAGVVSWGVECGQEGNPGVYIKVSSYRDWIDGTIAKG